jgi:hypothetical protein
MYYKNLPVFKPVTQEELRRIWTENSDPDIRRMALEITRYRGVLKESGDLFQAIHDVWRKEVGGGMVAIHMLKQLMDTERHRVPEDK